METAPCPITGSREFTPFLQAPDRFNLQSQLWQLAQSSASGLVMLDPRPRVDQMATHYPAEAYDPFLNRTSANSLRDKAYLAISDVLLAGKARVVMKGIDQPADSAQVLEVGCSTGRLLLRIYRDFGVPLANLCGVEIDRQAAETARSAGIGSVSESGLDETSFERRFDRIVFWHALEHLHRINESLARARELLKPGGQLVIAVPNLQSDDARRYGPNWIALDAPRHLWHFTPETLRKLLEKHGFSVLEFGRWIPDTLYNVWYSEKLDCAVKGQRFGFGGITRATTNALRSLAKGRDPRQASSMIVRAVVEKSE